MARASSYTKLTELTSEQQAKFKETATILAQGKTATDGATTDINIPFDEFSGGGGGGYTRATAAFGEQYSKPYPWYPQNNGLAQDITISNNTYTLATNFIPNYRYYNASEDNDVN